MEPSWDLSIPSPLSLTQEMGGGLSNGPSSTQNTPRRIVVGMPENTISIVDPITPSSSNVAARKSISSSQNGEFSLGSDVERDFGNFTTMDTRAGRRTDVRKIFVAIKNCSAADLLELERSAIATIEKCRENYICVHDIADYITRKVGSSNVAVKWKHYDDRTFLFALQDRNLHDKFLQCSRNVLISDTPVSFKAWQPYSGTVKKPCKFKVWLRLTGLPVEHFCYNTVERVVCGFGRLYKCNMEKKQTWVGCFYVMIDCADIDDVEPRVIIQTDNDSEQPVFVDKIYACPLDVYNAQKFGESTMAYDDILSDLMDRGKITAL